MHSSPCHPVIHKTRCEPNTFQVQRAPSDHVSNPALMWPDAVVARRRLAALQFPRCRAVQSTWDRGVTQVRVSRWIKGREEGTWLDLQLDSRHLHDLTSFTQLLPDHTHSNAMTIWMLSFHLHLVLSCGVFLSGFPTTILYALNTSRPFHFTHPKYLGIAESLRSWQSLSQSRNPATCNSRKFHYCFQERWFIAKRGMRKSADEMGVTCALLEPLWGLGVMLRGIPQSYHNKPRNTDHDHFHFNPSSSTNAA
jgi:hypothetical protein